MVNTQDFYWHTYTNDAVDEYVDNQDLTKRELDQLYTRRIHPALMQMIGAIIHRYQYYETGYSVKDLKFEALSKAYEVLAMSRKHPDKYYQPERKSSFFYFTSVIRYYIINLQKENQERVKRITDVDIDTLNEEDINSFEADYLLDTYLDWLDENYKNLFTHDVDLQIIEAFINVVKEEFDNLHQISLLSEKVFNELTYDDDESYYLDRYYKVKTICNEVYNQLRRMYDLGKSIHPDVELSIRKRY
jgi:hypothetical protein